MADLPEEQPDLGTREEDGPQVDVESGTEKGEETTQRVEKTILSSINQPPNPQPVMPCIPKSLYDKAKNQQDELTRDERDLLLSRNDLVGKALAQPDSLTVNERHQALFWPPPDEVRANIQRVTGGKLSTPHELYATVKDAMVRGQFNEEEIALVGRNFYADIATFCSRANLAELLKPGTSQAAELLRNRMKLKAGVHQRALAYLGLHVIGQYRRSEPSVALSGLSGVPSRFEPPLSTPLALADIQPGRPWATASKERTPLNLFMETTKLRGFEVHPGWYALPEDQREAYRARVETLRLEDWAEYRTATAEGRSLLPDGSRHLIYEGPLPRPLPEDTAAAPFTHRDVGPESVYTTGLQLLHGDLGQGVEFQEVLSRWHALTQEQLEMYEARAATARRAVQDAEIGYISGIKVFNDEIGVGIELQDVLRRWDTLTKEQKGAYEEKAMWARHAAKSARYQRERNNGAR